VRKKILQIAGALALLIHDRHCFGVSYHAHRSCVRDVAEIRALLLRVLL